MLGSLKRKDESRTERKQWEENKGKWTDDCGEHVLLRQMCDDLCVFYRTAVRVCSLPLSLDRPTRVFSVYVGGVCARAGQWDCAWENIASVIIWCFLVLLRCVFCWCDFLAIYLYRRGFFYRVFFSCSKLPEWHVAAGWMPKLKLASRCTRGE